jgi:hypothetical protein
MALQLFGDKPGGTKKLSHYYIIVSGILKSEVETPESTLTFSY